MKTRKKSSYVILEYHLLTAIRPDFTLEMNFFMVHIRASSSSSSSSSQK
jgi:hypothetical protein